MNLRNILLSGKSHKNIHTAKFQLYEIFKNAILSIICSCTCDKTEIKAMMRKEDRIREGHPGT